MERQADFTLPQPILTGDERAKELSLMRVEFKDPEADRLIAARARRDPSLLLESSDRHTSYLAGTRLDEAVYFDYVETVQVALEAGVHPDDPRAFQATLLGGGQVGQQRLIAYRVSTMEGRFPRPRMLELALKHGADPDGDIEAFESGRSNSHVRRYATDLHDFNGSLALARLPDTLECIRLLLNANPRCIDPDEAGSNREWYGFLALLGSASALKSRPSLTSDLAKQFRSVAVLALAKGASLNYVVPDEGLPQALWLARAGWPTMSAILVELGAADSWKLEPGVNPESFFSGEGLAFYREALMRRRLQHEVGKAADIAGQAARSCRRGARL
ncbi:hypothetical protein [Methylibium petroleiphilum]|uniref:Uncharacterized protein n=1 Tax=Methylibium petroleiphilum (strain ATCC BAA-1232 / LMG 22953 / PM1) TaxID=420662 RepID=A2SPC1_METPP|nr:hypothetical protein [Methylibium petroleiphilum]ABM97410.1 hypothetical protein Mpe_B0646 [Methylibium petroleiphilum PM1]